MGSTNPLLAIWISIAAGAVLLAPIRSAHTSQSEGSYRTTASVNVRKGPGTNYPTVAKIPKGAKVEVVGKQGSWLKVQSKHGNPPGYVDSRFAVRDKERTVPAAAYNPGTYTTTATVNVRKGAGTHYPILSKIPRNTKVQVVGSEGEWLKVQSKHGNPAGYIQKTYAKRLTG